MCKVDLIINGESETICFKEMPYLFVNKKYIHDNIVKNFGDADYSAMCKLPSFGVLSMKYNGKTFAECGLINKI